MKLSLFQFISCTENEDSKMMMSSAETHWVIKFRFIRSISTLIKTLTPSYALEAPDTFGPLVERMGPANGRSEEERKPAAQQLNVIQHHCIS